MTLIRKMCYFFFMFFFPIIANLISNTLDTFYLSELMCTNERHTKKTLWNWLIKWGIQWSDKHKKVFISNYMNFILTESYIIYNFHLFLATLCLNVSRTESLNQMFWIELCFHLINYFWISSTEKHKIFNPGTLKHKFLLKIVSSDMWHKHL